MCIFLIAVCKLKRFGEHASVVNVNKEIKECTSIRMTIAEGILVVQIPAGITNVTPV